MLEAARAFYADVCSRRSVREFSDQPVSREAIENALLAAGTAPNGEIPALYFVAISEPALKKKIRQAAEQEEVAFYQHRASEEWLDAWRDGHQP